MNENDFHGINVQCVALGWRALCTCGWQGSVKDRMSYDHPYANAREDCERHWEEVQKHRADTSSAGQS